MQTMFSPLRAALATRSTDATPVASVAVAPATAGVQAEIATVVTDASADAHGTMNAGLLESLPRSELDELRQSSQSATTAAVPRRNELDSFGLRDLTLPYSAFASVAMALPKVNLGEDLGLTPDGRELGGDRFGGPGKGSDILGAGSKFDFKVPGGGGPDGHDINPRADLGDGDGSGKQPWDIGVRLPGGVVLPGGVIPAGDPDDNPRAGGDGDGDGTGKRPGKFGPNGPRGGDPEGGWGLGGFHAFDIDDILPYYRDPDLDPRAQAGIYDPTACGVTEAPDCGNTGCGCSSTGTDCGVTSCGATSNPGCGTTDTPDCGGTGCGETSCGATQAPGIDPFSLFSRTELLRQQLAAQLVVANVKPAI